MNLAAALGLAVHRYPEADAIVTPEGSLSYNQWNCRINSVAWRLYKAGIQPGDRVAICSANGEPPATMYFAAQKIGAVAVLLNSRWKEKELAYALNDSASKAIFYDQVSEEEVLKALRSNALNPLQIVSQSRSNNTEKDTILTYEKLTDSPEKQPPNLDREETEIGTILYTSGTTGIPKGVCRTCRSDYYASLALIIEHRWSRFERILGVMPLYHTMGLHTLISMVLLNGAVVMLPKADPAESIKAIEAEKITALYLVPTIYHDLVEHLNISAKSPLKVPKLAYAGAPMPVHLINKCRDTFCPDVFVNQYGSTEMLAITINPRLDINPVSVGRPALHSRIRIVAADRNRRVLPDETLARGEVGEVIVEATSPQAFSGYLNKPEQTEQVLRNGWYFTGDLGFIDEKGDLVLSGRIDDMIISGGENIFPYEVERILLSHPLVKDAAVVGVPDERWGEVVTAFIVPDSVELESEMLERFCRESPELARYKRPRHFIFVKEIPKSVSGKVLYSILKKEALSLTSKRPLK